MSAKNIYNKILTTFLVIMVIILVGIAGYAIYNAVNAKIVNDESEEFIHELQKGNLAKIQKASPNIDYEEDFPDENQSIESLEKMKEKITEYIDYMKKHELIQSCRTLDEIKEELKKTILNF